MCDNEVIGQARQGKARQGKARQGKARQGKARQGKARQGKARHGNVRGQDRLISQGHAKACKGMAECRGTESSRKPN